MCGFLALAPKFKNMLRIYELNKKVTFSKGVLISLPARESEDPRKMEIKFISRA